MPPIENDRPMTVDETARFLQSLGWRIQKSTLNKLRTYGGGPEFLRFGGRVYYRPSVSKAWAEARAMRCENTSVTAHQPAQAAA